MYCINCNTKTKNKKFCSRSCAATFNNKIYKKRIKKVVPPRKCVLCGTEVEKYKKLCKTCKEKPKHDYQRVKSFRNRAKIKAVEYCGGKCTICGYNKCITALEFHHLSRETKDFSISANANKAWSKIVAELDKCILLCSNCHREVHSGYIEL